MKRRLGAVLLGLVVALVAAEIVLRAGAAGPLDAWEVLQAQRSEVLHHRYTPRDDDARLSLHGACGGREPARVLFLGDSWLADGIFVETFAGALAARCDACLEAVNGATQSYAPSLYLLKGRLLAARYPPRLAFVNLDATDPGDEGYRYQGGKIRDPDGRLLAVPFSRDPYAVKRALRVQRYQGSPSRLVRWLGGWWHDRFVLPRLGPDEMGPHDVWTLLGPLTSPDGRRTHPGVVAEFDGAVRELFAGLRDTVGPGRVIAAHHPHRRGVLPDPSGERHSRLLPELVAAAAVDLGVRFLDATPDVAAIHAGELPRAWLEGDPFSHLTGPGLRRYAVYAAGRLGADLCPLLASSPDPAPGP